LVALGGEGSVELKPTIIVFSTSEKELNQFIVNSVLFDVKEPQSLMPLIFRTLIPELRLRGVYAYPHRGKLYFISSPGIDSAEKLLTGLCGALNKFYEEAVKQVCRSGECLKHACQNITVDIALENLNPVENISDFIIVRSIAYEYLRSMFYRKAVLSHLDNRGREGLTAYLKHLHKRSIGEYTYTIVQGLRFFLEVTPKGRGRLWIDMVTRTREENPLDPSQRPRFLSHHEMKERSEEMYRAYLSNARLPPHERYSKIDEYLRTLGIDDKIEVRYAVFNPETRSMESRALVFVQEK